MNTCSAVTYFLGSGLMAPPHKVETMLGYEQEALVVYCVSKYIDSRYMDTRTVSRLAATATATATESHTSCYHTSALWGIHTVDLMSLVIHRVSHFLLPHLYTL
ncbi:hypothetical protein J6590_045919 [Homalodisca vitripennis]|nr:hypothetical protein J6590_045919 [Homalodisca vitripennis]